MATASGSPDAARLAAAVDALAGVLAERDTGITAQAIRWMALSTGDDPATRRDRDLKREWLRVRDEHADVLGGFSDDELRGAADLLRQGAEYALDGLILPIHQHNARRPAEPAARAAG